MKTSRRAPAGVENAVRIEQDAAAHPMGELPRIKPLDPEAALRGATAKFRDRFTAVESLAAARGIDMGTAELATLDALWDEVKLRRGV